MNLQLTACVTVAESVTVPPRPPSEDGDATNPLTVGTAGREDRLAAPDMPGAEIVAISALAATASAPPT